MDLKAKHVLVTGAAKRVGRRIAETLLPHGIRLTAHYHHSVAEVESLRAQAESAGNKVIAISADLRQVSEIQRLVREAEAAHGPVDVLVNSASDFYPTPALEVTEAQWDGLMDLNLKGQFFLAQACGKQMVARGGVILNLGDVNGERPMRNFAPYVASKAGLLMLTRNLALEWAPKVRVNSISPGAVLLPPHYTEAQKQRSEERSLLKRLGSPDDIAEAALFLIRNDYITGFDLKVDGGRILA